jgi:hypothetical protein
MGMAETPGIPCALSISMARFLARLGRCWRRVKAEVCLVIASEAKQSRAMQRLWIASSLALLAMTTRSAI